MIISSPSNWTMHYLRGAARINADDAAAAERLARQVKFRAYRNETGPKSGTCERCGGRCRKSSPVCATCQSEGWRGGRCECGALLHKRDYPGAKVKRAAACAKCRAENIRQQREYQSSPNGKEEV